MTTIFEVTVKPNSIYELTRIRRWCRANTQEFTDSAEDTESQHFSVQYSVDHFGRVTSTSSKSLPVMFYFFNDVDAMHFRLRFAEYL
ncbi:hypothetical protein [Paraburkholderia graminis]